MSAIPEVTPNVSFCFNEAMERSQAQGKQLGSSHMLSSAMQYSNNSLFPLFQRIGAQPDSILEDSKKLEHGEPANTNHEMTITDSFINALQSSTTRKIIDSVHSDRISLESMVAIIASAKDETAAMLHKHGVTTKKIVAVINGLDEHDISGSENKNRGIADTALGKYGEDLTQKAEDGKIDPVIGRDTETRRVMQILSRRTKNNPVIVGEGGTGKTAVVEGLARRIVAGDCPEQLKDKKIYLLDLAALSAGAKYQGEYEERVKEVLKGISESQGKIITFIDEIHMIAGSSTNPMNLANMLKPMLARGELRLIGATTTSEYRQFIEADPALERRFQVVQVDEPSVEDTIGILRGIKEKYEIHHGIKIQDSSLISCAELSQRYINGRFLPDKAIDLMDESASRLKMLIDSRPEIIDQIEKEIRSLDIERLALEKESSGGAADNARLSEIKMQLAEKNEQLNSEKIQWKNMHEGIEKVRTLKKQMSDLENKAAQLERSGDFAQVADIRYTELPEVKEKIEKEEQDAISRGIDKTLMGEEVTPEVVADVVSAWTGIPANKMTESETERVLTMGDKLEQRVVGQREAVESLVKAIKKSKAGVSDPSRPIGSFLFAGASGSGKTEISKALAEFLYDDDKALIVFSMEEYSEKASVNKLIGSPAGYVGYGDTPALERVRNKPSSVVLFDELEKADDQVIITLLSILEEGKITLNNGKEVVFNNTVIICTSNLGAGQDNSRIMESIKARLRPEFINRLDAIIPFNALTVDNLKKVVDIQVSRLEKNMSRKHITFTTTDAARDWIATNGYDPAYGARPVRRIVTGVISDMLADEILEKRIEEGDHVIIDVKQDKLVIYPSGEKTHVVENSEGVSAPVEDGGTPISHEDRESVDNMLNILNQQSSRTRSDGNGDSDDTDGNSSKTLDDLDSLFG